MYFSAFSTPGQGDFVALAEALSLRSFRKALDAINGLADQLGMRSLKLKPGQLPPDALATRLFRPELGAVRLGLRGGLTRDDWPWLAAQMSMAGLLAGVVPSLDLVLPGSRPLFVAGHVVDGEGLRLVADDTGLGITGPAGDVLRLAKISLPGIPPVWSRDPQRQVLRLGSAGAATFSSGAWEPYWYPGSPPIALARDQERSKRTLESALTLLEEHLPINYLWTMLLLHELVPEREPKPDGTTSGSSLSWPGHVRISQSSVLQTIIMLTHECSHQYFHLVQWNASVVKKGAPAVYSVLKETKRPLDKVLLGYHAFANVVLVLAQLRNCQTTIARTEIDHQLYSVGRLVAELAGVLEDQGQFLNQAGLSLYEPLRDRMAATVNLAASRRAS
jgi:HEXXH motif-containing protein